MLCYPLTQQKQHIWKSKQCQNACKWITCGSHFLSFLYFFFFFLYKSSLTSSYHSGSLSTSNFVVTFLSIHWSPSSRNAKCPQFSSVQSISLVLVFVTPWLQHARPPCPSPNPGVYSNSSPLSRWCHPTISSSVVPFSSCPQPLPASGSFPMSQLFTWGGQSIGVSVSASVPPINTWDWSPLRWTGWITLQSKGLSRVLSLQFISINYSALSFLYSPTLISIRDYWKNHGLN